jgi:hypothetical protein
MPIEKFKSFEAASKAIWNLNPDDDYYKRMARFYNLVLRLSKIYVSTGIFKFHNLTEAEKHRNGFR